MAERPLLVIDGDNLAHRAYHSMPKTTANNAIAGFFSMLSNVWRKELPRAVFVAWDTLGVDTYRSELWPEYQQGRVFEASLLQQLNKLPEICREFDFGVGKIPGYEADDIIASAVRAELQQGGSCVVYTTDRDAYQLVCENVTVLAPQPRGKEPLRVGAREVVEKFGVLPEQVADFKALCGDASDNIPGVRGIGPKAAASLLLKHGTLEKVLECWDRDADSETARMFREVVGMRADAEVSLPERPPDWKRGAAALRSIGLDNLADRIEEL